MAINKILAGAAAIAALLFASCTSDDARVDALTGEPIAYDLGSRLANDQFEAGDNFAVWATHQVDGEASVYFDNQIVTLRSDGWRPNQAYYWPVDGSLDFFALSPAPSSMPDGTEIKVVDGPKPLAYISLPGFDNTVDILAAHSPSLPCSRRGSVPLRFSHMLSRAVFVLVDSCKYGSVLDVNVRSVKVTAKVRTQGRLDWDDMSIIASDQSREQVIEIANRFIPAYGVDTIGVYYLLPQHIESIKVEATWAILNNGFVAEEVTVKKDLENNRTMLSGMSSTYKLVLKRKEQTSGGIEGDISIF